MFFFLDSLLVLLFVVRCFSCTHLFFLFFFTFVTALTFTPIRFQSPKPTQQAYVGPIRRIAGDDAITNVHRIAFGVYETFALETSSYVPSECAAANYAAVPREAVLFAAVLVLWCASCVLFMLWWERSERSKIRRNENKNEKNENKNEIKNENKNGKLKCVSFLSKFSVNLLSVCYGTVCSSVFHVVTGWRPYSTYVVVLGWAALILYVVGFPLLTFFALLKVERRTYDDDDNDDKDDNDERVATMTMTTTRRETQMPKGWVREVDADGQQYYFQRNSGSSQWEAPKGSWIGTFSGKRRSERG